MASWAPATRSSYATAARKWLKYTKDNNISVTHPTTHQCMEFLTEVSNTGVGHSSLSTQKSFLSCFITIEGRPVGDHPMVTKLVRGAKVLNPPQEPYTYIWDPVHVLTAIAAWGDIGELDLDKLTRRTLMLFMLATGQRIQSAYALLRKDMMVSEDSIRIKYTTKLKSNDPKKNPLMLRFNKHQNERTCVFSHLRAYLQREDTKGSDPRVFGTIKTPVTPASSVSLSRYIKLTLKETGIKEHFTAYSVRHAATSAADRLNVPINDILASAGWARTSTFAKFYNRPLLEEEEEIQHETNFITALLP